MTPAGWRDTSQSFTTIKRKKIRNTRQVEELLTEEESGKKRPSQCLDVNRGGRII